MPVKFLFPLFIFLLSLIFRAYMMGIESFSLDEMASLFYIQGMGEHLFKDTNPPLYYLLLKIYHHFVHINETFSRLPSVCLSAAAVSVSFFSLTRFCKSRYAQVFGLLLLILNPLSIEFSQYVRSYALIEFLTALFCLCLILRKRLPGFILSLCLLATHWFGAFLVALALLDFYTSSKKVTRQRSRLLFLVASIIFVGLTALVKIRSYSVSWQTHRFEATPFLKEIHLTCLELFWHSPFYPLLFVTLLWVLTKGFFSKAHQAGEFIRKPEILLAVFFTFYPLILITLSAVLERSLFLPRYLAFMIPVSALLAAWCFDQLLRIRTRFKWMYLVLSSTFIVSGAVASTKVYEIQTPPWKDAINYIAHGRQGPVFTSRTLALRIYGDRRDLKIYPFDGSEASAKIIFENIDSFGSVWLIDNYWGSISYWASIKAEATKRGHLIHELSFGRANQNPILVMELRR